MSDLSLETEEVRDWRLVRVADESRYDHRDLASNTNRVWEYQAYTLGLWQR